MSREDAKGFLIDISYKLGNMAVEYLTEKDGEKMREAVKVLEQESDPCDFCSIIYPDADAIDIVFRRGKYSDIVLRRRNYFDVDIESFITIDNEGKYHVNIDPGDTSELVFLDDIKFCPYCGRKLAESEG